MNTDSSAITYDRDADGVVTLTLDAPGRSANTMDALFRSSLKETVERLTAEREQVTGIVITSAKKTFFAGGDLNELIKVTPETAQDFAAGGNEMKGHLRAIETMGVPVVAAINGAALGGGWEIALSCHRRIAVNNPKIKLGLPEVTLGLLPGGGGVVRTVRLIGLAAALPLLTEGRQLTPEKAQQAGLLHELVETPDELLTAAKAWIKDNPTSAQPFDAKGYQIPGGSVRDAGMMMAAIPAMLRKKTHGTQPAPEAIVSAAVESMNVDVDTALRVETAYLAELAAGQISKNMISAFFFQLNQINGGGSRPDGPAKRTPTKIGVIGAGMMGAGIAHVASTRGIEVVLVDASLEAAERGKKHGADILDAKVAKGRLAQDKRDATLALVTPVDDAAQVAGCDLVIEAVFEDRKVKAEVHNKVAAAAPEATIASNTSTLPITGLASAVPDPAKFVGMHFFSPVHKMQLVELIRGEKTSDETLAFAFDTVLALGKTPIVVNDARGFFTSRVFGTFTSEGQALLGEGVPAARIETEALKAGMPVGPLAVSDEVSMTLMLAIRKQTLADIAETGDSSGMSADHPGFAVTDKMVNEFNRPGKAKGAGFYDYPESGGKRLWPGLAENFGKADGGAELTGQDIRDRFLFAEALESVRCVEEGVIDSVADANIGSIFGIGYAPWTGGVLQFLNGYGLPQAVERAKELAERFGERFAPPALLVAKAEAGEQF
ncbi:3-hydroxyacyl-CoA dehydrogenase NAD-binding domain-containing protein [Rhodococcus sp. X156]|uniref:3-hydroxyacyl-CoA dehydrogenase NAD-binding domain-containing protein n=1 Tax=Rhodococcus sp. X156 TaxID=2499145 RepID=UPI000FD7CA99|nr:3-hydroxyacyl-CoA dehydrogenase NAD-binding domain-containing protein [Rhodococcus sp. X156]